MGKKNPILYIRKLSENIKVDTINKIHTFLIKDYEKNDIRLEIDGISKNVEIHLSANKEDTDLFIKMLSEGKELLKLIPSLPKLLRREKNFKNFKTSSGLTKVFNSASRYFDFLLLKYAVLYLYEKEHYTIKRVNEDIHLAIPPDDMNEILDAFYKGIVVEKKEFQEYHSKSGWKISYPHDRFKSKTYYTILPENIHKIVVNDIKVESFTSDENLIKLMVSVYFRGKVLLTTKYKYRRKERYVALFILPNSLKRILPKFFIGGIDLSFHVAGDMVSFHLWHDGQVYYFIRPIDILENDEYRNRFAEEYIDNLQTMLQTMEQETE